MIIRGLYKPSANPDGARRRSLDRRLAAIIGLDVAGYSVLMGMGEEDAHRRVGAELDRIIKEIEKSRGRVFSFSGDGLMAEFPSAVEALKCGLRIQLDNGRRQTRLPPDRRIIFRIGVNSGEIVVQGDRSGGNAVNIAARLESIAEPGGIALSDAVFQQVSPVVTAPFSKMGEVRLKNIRAPVLVYTIPASACSSWAEMPTLPRRSYDAANRHSPSEYRRSLAVLPFRTLQRDQSDAYFAEGIVDDIIHVLGGLNDLLVIARSSTQLFARAPLDLRRIEHELDVHYVLHGSVRADADRLRITVELCETPTGRVIWTERFDGQRSDIFDLQDQIAVRVASSIMPQLRERELTHAMRKRPESMTAYDLALQALNLFHRVDKPSHEEARRLLLKAVEHDPCYALAHSYLAYLYMAWIGQGWSSDDAADVSLAAHSAETAIRYDPNEPLALAIFGHVQSYGFKKYHVARDFLDRALACGPSCAWAWSLSGLTHAYLQKTSLAIDHTEKAIRLAPIGTEAYWFEHYLSIAYYFDGRYGDAIAWGKMSAAHAVGNLSNLRVLAAAHVGAGEMDAARAVVAQLLTLDPMHCVGRVRARTPFPGEIRSRFVEQLKAAGLPE